MKVDGVITGSKLLMLDMVEEFSDITTPGVDGVLTRELAEKYSDGVLSYACLPSHVSLRGKRCFDEDGFLPSRRG